MTFSDFAQILYKYRGGCKYKFTHELLTSGLAVSSPVLDKLKETATGKDRLRKYLSGDRDITEIASEILVSFDKGVFIDTIITDYEEHFDEISTAFANSDIQINPDDVPERLTEIFMKIIETAAAGNSQKTALSSTLEDASLSLDSSFILSAKKAPKRLLRILTQIAWKYDELMDFTKSIVSFSDLKAKEESIEQEIEVVSQFVALNQRLWPYIKRYSDFSSLTKLYNKSSMIDVELYKIWACRIDIDSPILAEYESLLKTCINEAQALPD